MVNWLVDEILQERQYESEYPSLSDAAIQLGHMVYRTKYIPFSKEPDWGVGLHFPEGSCTITYGTVQFCRQIEKHFGRMWTPGMYFNENVKSFCRFAQHIESRDLLSDDYYIIPYGEFVRRQYVKAGFTTFIKPESGLKEFTGQVVTASTFENDIKKLSPYGVVDDNTLCVLAPPKDIKAEFRYVICEKEVITGSEYRWDDVLDVRRDTHPTCDQLANKIAKADWQADTVYVCDVALLPDDTAKVIELNAFSSSGLYACDTYKIVEAVSRAAMREYLGGIEDQ
jgi:ATP-grasp domain, R2K clade family 3